MCDSEWVGILGLGKSIIIYVFELVRDAHRLAGLVDGLSIRYASLLYTMEVNNWQMKLLKYVFKSNRIEYNIIHIANLVLRWIININDDINLK